MTDYLIYPYLRIVREPVLNNRWQYAAPLFKDMNCVSKVLSLHFTSSLLFIHIKAGNLASRLPDCL